MDPVVKSVNKRQLSERGSGLEDLLTRSQVLFWTRRKSGPRSTKCISKKTILGEMLSDRDVLTPSQVLFWIWNITSEHNLGT